MTSASQSEYIELPQETYLELTHGAFCDDLPPEEPSLQPNKTQWFSCLDVTQVLRWCGGILLGTAGIAFMCQGVYSFSPMARHWMMLAICVLMAGLGGVTGSLMKEAKGARTFFGFATAWFPVLASQMGAMVFSLFGRPPAGMPQPLVFSLSTLGTVSAVVAFTLVVTVSVSYFGFRILGASKAGWLTGLFTFANMCILLPVRQGAPAGLIIAGVAVLIYWSDTTLLSKDFRLANLEGRACRIMLTTPLLVMLGRNLFYPVGTTYMAMMLGLLGAYLSFHWGRTVRNGATQTLLQLAGLSSMAVAWLSFIIPLVDQAHFGEGMMIYLLLLPIALIVSLHAYQDQVRLADTYRLGAAVIAVLGVLAAHLMDGSLAVSMIGTLAALTVIAAGTLVGSKPIFFTGFTAALVSLGNVALKAVANHANYTWMMLTAVGILVLFGASMAERGRDAWQQKVSALWGRMHR